VEELQSDMYLPQRETQHDPGAGPGFHRRPVRMGFLVDKVALGQVSLRVFLSFLSVIIQSLLHSHAFTYQRRCVISAASLNNALKSVKFLGIVICVNGAMFLDARCRHPIVLKDFYKRLIR
jgi:hypothetical protein